MSGSYNRICIYNHEIIWLTHKSLNSYKLQSKPWYTTYIHSDIIHLKLIFIDDNIYTNSAINTKYRETKTNKNKIPSIFISFNIKHNTSNIKRNITNFSFIRNKKLKNIYSRHHFNIFHIVRFDFPIFNTKHHKYQLKKKNKSKLKSITVSLTMKNCRYLKLLKFHRKEKKKERKIFLSWKITNIRTF